MKSIKKVFIGLALIPFTSIGAQDSAPSEKEAEEKTEAIQNTLEIEKTTEDFKKDYIEYSVNPEESRRYLDLIESNRELFQVVKERRLVIEMTQQEIELMEQYQKVDELRKKGEDRGVKASQPTALFNQPRFLPKEEEVEEVALLKMIRNGKKATFSVGDKWNEYTEGERLPTGELIQSIHPDRVVLKEANGTEKVLYGLPVGD